MKVLNWLIIIIAIFGLIGVRMVEGQLFYDPFLDYFKTANKTAHFPDFVWGKLIASHLFRFAINFILSLIIIYFLFRRKDWTVQAGILMALVFVITFPVYLFCIYSHFELGYLISFYMRRFVIQPLILLLIIPMFYYRKSILENKQKSTL